MILREMKLLPSGAERKYKHIQTFQTLVWESEKTIT